MKKDIRKLLSVGSLSLAGLLTTCDVDRDKTIDSGIPSGEDAECVVSGCSGELCISKEMAGDSVGICEWEEEYKCPKLTSCVYYDGECGWDKTPEYLECLKETRE